MPTVLLLEDDEQRIQRIGSRLRAALPFIHLRCARSAIEFRYAFVSERPPVVILGQPVSERRIANLAWEVAALQPTARIIVLANPLHSQESWRTFGDLISDVVDEQGVVEAVTSATREFSPAKPNPCARAGSASPAAGVIDDHRLKNRMAGLLAGLHAMAAELRATAYESERIPEITDEYVDRLVDVVGDMCAMVAAAEACPCDEK